MTTMNDSSNHNQDDALADFTDRVLNGQVQTVDSSVTDELRGLEETVLRLKTSLPGATLDDATVKQMHVRLNARIRRETEQTKPTLWERLFPPQGKHPQARPQFGIAFAALAVIVALAVIIPAISTQGNTTATALNSSQNFFLAVVLIGVIAFILRVTRRK